MDTVQHIVHGIIISILTLNYAPHNDNFLLIMFWLFMATANVVASIYPDLVGLLEKVYRKDKTVWGWYNDAHKISLDNILVYIPGGFLHIYLDSFTHGEGKRWWVKGERLHWEIISWFITAIVIYLIWS